ncbi:MAG: hypothetical protein ACETWM_17190 [Candidatus Lokiarchaeia archaeon]
MSMFFLTDAILQANNTILLMSPNMSVVTSNIYNAQSIRSAIYGTTGILCLGLFFIFLICGELEKKK